MRRAGLSVFNERAYDRREVDRCPGWVCFEPGEPEEVVDQAAESFAVAGDGCFEAVALGAFGLFSRPSETSTPFAVMA